MEDRVILGAGCFWCAEAVFKQIKGVLSVTPGFSGGIVENPTYKMVCDGKTEHIEVIDVHFDSNLVSLSDLLDIFFLCHDPTSLDKQGNDVGLQYRSCIFVLNQIQMEIANNKIKEFEKYYGAKIVTFVLFFKNFYEADLEHFNYYELNKDKNKYCQTVISPKFEKMKKEIKARNLQKN